MTAFYWSAELAVECCQPEVREFDDDQAMHCPTCGGDCNFNQHTEHDVNGKPFEMSDECDLWLGSGVVLECDVALRRPDLISGQPEAQQDS